VSKFGPALGRLARLGCVCVLVVIWVSGRRDNVTDVTVNPAPSPRAS
jgi:hypothetical protein